MKDEKRSKRRNIWVDDVTWEKIKFYAEFHDTSVNAIINDFLKRIRITVPPDRLARARANKLNPPIENVKFVPAKVPDVCTHQSAIKLPYGSFCDLCGALLESKHKSFVITEEVPSEGTAPQNP